MKTKLIKKAQKVSTEYKFGDFFRNFIAVILGIIITFIGSDWIAERNKQKELREALLLVKNEMMLNRNNIEKMMQQEIFEQTGALYLYQYRHNMEKASPDSLDKYGSTPFRTSAFLPITDAMEMLKTTSLISAIKDKKLATQIIQTYNTIEGAHLTFDSFTGIKIQSMRELGNLPEVKKFRTNGKPTTTQENWTFYCKFPEGLQAISSIASVHDSPSRMYGRYIKQINETIAKLDETYNQ